MMVKQQNRNRCPSHAAGPVPISVTGRNHITCHVPTWIEKCSNVHLVSMVCCPRCETKETTQYLFDTSNKRLGNAAESCRWYFKSDVNKFRRETGKGTSRLDEKR